MGVRGVGAILVVGTLVTVGVIVWLIVVTAHALTDIAQIGT